MICSNPTGRKRIRSRSSNGQQTSYPLTSAREDKLPRTSALLPRGSPFGDLFQILGPHLFFKVPIFTISSLRAREKSVQPPSNDDHLIIQCKWHKHCHSALNDDKLCLCEYLKKNLYFNELARFGQYFKYTLFGSPFLLLRVPIWSPFHSKLGPHQVPIEKNLGPPSMWEQCNIYS